jgi:diketogulonate reductase-like aldo/keto reductase
MTFVGYGTYRLTPEEAYNMVTDAVKNGYRAIDTAQLYKNEKAVGQAIIDTQIDRDKIFITTKIVTKKIYKGKDAMEKSIIASLENLKTHIDLLLLHGYVGRASAWSDLEELQQKYSTQIHYIGVSNYSYEQLSELLGICKQKPYANQIEYSPFYTRPELIKLCRDNNILVIGHSIFCQNQKDYNIDSLNTLSDKYKCSIYQIIIKWCLMKNISVVFGTPYKENLIENLKLDFCLEDRDIDIIDGLNENFHLYPRKI